MVKPTTKKQWERMQTEGRALQREMAAGTLHGPAATRRIKKWATLVDDLTKRFPVGGGMK